MHHINWLHCASFVALVIGSRLDGCIVNWVQWKVRWTLHGFETFFFWEFRFGYVGRNFFFFPFLLLTFCLLFRIVRLFVWRSVWKCMKRNLVNLDFLIELDVEEGVWSWECCDASAKNYFSSEKVKILIKICVTKRCWFSHILRKFPVI